MNEWITEVFVEQPLALPGSAESFMLIKCLFCGFYLGISAIELIMNIMKPIFYIEEKKL